MEKESVKGKVIDTKGFWKSDRKTYFRSLVIHTPPPHIYTHTHTHFRWSDTTWNDNLPLGATHYLTRNPVLGKKKLQRLSSRNW